MSLTTITGPATDAVTLAAVKAAGRIDGTEFDSQIAILIPAFTREAEHKLGRRLITQTVELVLDEFPTDDVDLLLPSVQSITSVIYTDTAGSTQTLSASKYALDSENTPCWLLPVDPWPATYDGANAVRIRYVAGYGAADTNVPPHIRTWITAHVLQALQSPTGLMDDGKVSALPYLDNLLHVDAVCRVW